MPRKSIPRAFKLACKHYKGFDRHFATKAIATRKLQASQGAVNQKLASSSDAKYGTASGTPLVRTYAANHHHPSFAAHPVSARTRSASKHVASYHSSASHSPAAAQQLAAPSFAAAPVWQSEGKAGNQHLRSAGAASPFARDTEMAEAASPSSSTGGQGLKSDPVYQYAKMGRSHSAEGPRRLTLTRRTSDRLAIKWFGSLDKRPISKVSTATSASSRLSPPSGDKARLASAWSAYADLDGPKH